VFENRVLRRLFKLKRDEITHCVCRVLSYRFLKDVVHMVTSGF
jgi:hypothetical protein